MAAPTSIGGAGTAISGGNTATGGSGAVPAGLATGDVLLAVTFSGASQAYETVTDNNLVAFTRIDGQASANMTVEFWWLRVGTTVPTGWTVDRGAGGGQLLCRLFGFRGCVETGTPFEAATLGSQASTTTPASSAITTLGADRLAVCLTGFDDDPAPASGYPPAGWSDEGADAATSGSDARVFGVSIVQASAGNVASVTLGTWSLAAFAQSLTLALIPAATGTTYQKAGAAVSAAVAAGPDVFEAVETGAAVTSFAAAAADVFESAETGTVTSAAAAAAADVFEATETGVGISAAAAAGTDMVEASETGAVISAAAAAAAHVFEATETGIVLTDAAAAGPAVKVSPAVYEKAGSVVVAAVAAGVSTLITSQPTPAAGGLWRHGPVRDRRREDAEALALVLALTA